MSASLVGSEMCIRDSFADLPLKPADSRIHNSENAKRKMPSGVQTLNCTAPGKASELAPEAFE
eukprot:15125992-Alexandrium_andersonii.AAC.1